MDTTYDARAGDLAARRADESHSWRDFLEIFYAPRRVFERRRDGRFFLALVVYTVTLALLMYVVYPLTESLLPADLKRQFGADGFRQMSGMLSHARMLTVPTVLVFAPIGAILSTGVLWAITKLLGDVPVAYRSALVISIYSSFPALLSVIGDGLQAMVMDVHRLASSRSLLIGVGRFVATDAPAVLVAFADALTLFHLWTLGLVALGLHVVLHASWRRAVLVTVIYAAIGLVPSIAQALMQASR